MITHLLAYTLTQVQKSYDTFWIKAKANDLIAGLQICLSSLLTTSNILQETFVIDWLIGGCVGWNLGPADTNVTVTVLLSDIPDYLPTECLSV